ncbi:helix-turn-helix domain-containing protein [Halorientalis pallida]|uniref:helix-turn-helix domain-containing protein n=1 Tax=Halorientalis pallida TaxID=2479928 RepID=UPI003C6FF71F
MPRKRDKETGLFEEVYSRDDILDTLRGTRLSTSEVADALNCHRTTAHERLTELEEDGIITSSEAGNTLIWEVQRDELQ